MPLPLLAVFGSSRTRPASRPLSKLLLAVVGFAATCSIAVGAATFDFDTATPVLNPYQNLPVDQTAGGVTAHFTAVAGSFSIQTDGTTGFSLPGFSGKYLYPNNLRGNVLRVQFSRELTNIAFDFATTDYPPTEIPTPIVLTLFEVTPTGTNMVGSVTNRAAYGNGSFPMGTCGFTSGSNSFNRAEVQTYPGGDATFLVDNISVTQPVVTPGPNLSIRVAGSESVLVTWPSPSTGFVLQQSAALGATNWANVTNLVQVANGTNQVIISPATGDGFYRLFHP
jgi:hypothetical protein